MSTTFAQLGVPDSICDALARRGINEPFEIQAVTIADALAGRDVCGRAPTGSGKTLAFGIPLVATVERAKPNKPTALILAPTRELAEQINSELRSFAGKTRIGVVYGGVGYGPQLKSLRLGIDILVACPGRLEDLIQQGKVELGAVKKVVLDEADRMADMGFMPAVRRILDQTSKQRQTVLFSATLDGDIAKLTRDYQHDPVRHEVGEETPDIKAAQHVFWKVRQEDRTDVTADAVNAVWPAIIFCRTRHGSDRLAKRLAKSGIKAAAIHGGRSQGQRTRALSDFTKGRVHALVATDVAARGIHVDGVASVVHFDPPEDHKAYVHRSGRTARAGESGLVVSLIQPSQMKDTQKLQRQVGLDERITDPDAAALRRMSGSPTRALAPSADDWDVDGAVADADRGRSRGSGRQRSGGSGNPRNRSGGSGGSRNHRSGGPTSGSASGESSSQSKSKRTSNGPSGVETVSADGQRRVTQKSKFKGRGQGGNGGNGATSGGPKPKHKSRSGQGFAAKKGQGSGGAKRSSNGGRSGSGSGQKTSV